MPRKIILDVDTGVDDALALLLALRSPELEIVGITCVAGNITLDHVVPNTLAILDVADAADIPVAVGARKPLMAELRTATHFHGKNGLADIDLPPSSRRPVDETATEFITRIVRENPGNISVVAVGPLTNIALAILRDVNFARDVVELILMGGAISTPGNASGAAEANFSNDPEAASAVVECGADVKLVDLGATIPTVLPMNRISATRPRSPLGILARKLLDFYGPVCVSTGAAGAVLHDPLAVGLTVQPNFATYLPLHLSIETAGSLTRGASVANLSGLRSRVETVNGQRDVVGMEYQPFNANVARNIDVAGFLDFFVGRLELE